MAHDVVDVVAADVLEELPHHGSEDHARNEIAGVDLVAREQPEGGEEQQQVERERHEDSADEGDRAASSGRAHSPRRWWRRC